uniref:EF-hand calcium binding domain 14 n=1 Tax=Pavo cristatus TaxID=9049 RepID=A0A8C9FIY5_PAVCR
MKKRKELNALIGLAADGRRKKTAKKGSGHRLLRTEPPASDSESSSEEDEFAAAGGRGRCVKGDYLRCCKFCYPLCAFVILAACVVACVGLVWMQVALKEDLDVIKEKFRTSKYVWLCCCVLALSSMESCGSALSLIWLKHTFKEHCNQKHYLDLGRSEQISLLTSTVNHLKTNVKSASDLISLPVTVEKLQKTVATIGSTLTSVSHDVENIQTAIEEYKKSIEILQNDVVRNLCWFNRKSSKPTCLGFIFQESQTLHAALEELNNTIVTNQKLNDIKLLNVDSAIGNLSQRVMLLENTPVAVNKLDKRNNFSTSPVSMTVGVSETRDSQELNLREKLQLLDARASKPEDDRPIETSKNDLQDLFDKAPEDADGKLSFEDLQKLLGSAAQDSQIFQKFDTDGDEKYSLEELRSALGV